MRALFRCLALDFGSAAREYDPNGIGKAWARPSFVATPLQCDSSKGVLMNKRGIAAAAITAALALTPIPALAQEGTATMTPAQQVIAQAEQLSGQSSTSEQQNTVSEQQAATSGSAANSGSTASDAAASSSSAQVEKSQQPSESSSADSDSTGSIGEKGTSTSDDSSLETMTDSGGSLGETNESSTSDTTTEAGDTGATDPTSAGNGPSVADAPSTGESSNKSQPTDATASTDNSAAEAPAAAESVTEAPSIDANVHVQNDGWSHDPANDSSWTATQDAAGNDVVIGTTGQSLRLEALQLELRGIPNSGITYQAHVQNLGWTNWASDGSIVGTTGQSLRIEALRIMLTGDAQKKYSVFYQAHVEGLDWLDWTSDGLAAGTTGLGRRLEALRIRLVLKGDAAATPVTGTAYVVGNALTAQGHSQNIGWQDARVVDSGQVVTIGTTGQALRLEALRLGLDPVNEQGGIQYNAHVQNIGWQRNVDSESSWFSNGDVAGTTGESLRMEALQLNLTGDYARDFNIFYRVHVANAGWLGWTSNGLTAGTVGMEVPIEAVQIALVPKDEKGYASDQAAFADANFIKGIRADIATSDGATATTQAAVYGWRGYLFLPSFATDSNVSLHFSTSSDIWVSNSPAQGATWTKVTNNSAALPAGMLTSDTARVAYFRVGTHFSAAPLFVMNSQNLKSMFLASDDPVNKGIGYVEGSADHSAKATGSALVVQADGDSVYDGALPQIKGRGNYSWTRPQKSYQIKLDKKTSLIDGTKGNKAKTWLLISTYSDPALMRNYISYKLATAMGLAGTPDCEFVDLYYDGAYRGTYLLSEKVEINSGRVDIDEISNGSTVAGESDDDIQNHDTVRGTNGYGMQYQYVRDVQSPEDISGGYLLELDRAYYGPERSWFKTGDGATFVLKDPENASEVEVRYISEYMQHIMNHVNEAGQFDQLLDAKTAVGTWLVQTLAGNPDYYRYSSTYFYKKAGDSKLYSGPVWDMNVAFGIHNAQDGYDFCDPNQMGTSEMVFYYGSADFRKQTRDTFNQEFASLVSDLLGTTNNGKLESIESVGSKLAASQAMNQVLWGVTNERQFPVKQYTFQEAVDYLRDWTASRASYLNSTINGSSWC